MKIKAIIFLSLVSVLLSSCEDIIEVKLSDENVDLYAVEARITTEDDPSVFVYKSQMVNIDEPYMGISGAEVVITDNSQPAKTIKLQETSEKKGLYVPAEGNYFLGEPGKTYTLNITVDGVKITATETLFPVEPIDSMKVRPSIRGDYQFLGILTYGNEPPELGNFYKWDIYINHKLLYQSDYLVIASDELVNGNYISGFEIFTDFHDPNKPEERKINQGDTIQVIQTSISEFAYYFYYQMFNQGQVGGLFSVPPANIESNFSASNGKKVLGIFTASDVSNSNIVIVDESIESGLKK